MHLLGLKHNGYSLRAESFHPLDARWGLHSIDRFATTDNCQPLQAPHTGRFCPHNYSPAAV